MARAAEPECRVQAVRAVKPAPEKQKVSEASETKRTAADVTGTDFENETADTDTARNETRDTETAASRDADAEVAKVEAVQDAKSAELKRLEQERDCYKRAEQLARQRLDALQAYSAETITALNQIRSGQAGPGHRTAW